ATIAGSRRTDRPRGESSMPSLPSPGRSLWAAGTVVALGAFAAAARTGTAQKSVPPPDEYTTTARPLLAKYCLGCHSAEAKKGGLDLERFATAADARTDPKVWEGVIEQVEAGEMPPKGKPRPTDGERKRLLAW